MPLLPCLCVSCWLFAGCFMILPSPLLLLPQPSAEPVLRIRCWHSITLTSSFWLLPSEKLLIHLLAGVLIQAFVPVAGGGVSCTRFWY